ncbi:hypothetical protein AB0N06_08955 [Streptomyces sp. NPDC051020]|uniref:hypothetical protein n=1 Tax=Streptomyces sp. NPDC051020 TaxID=3155409 RepID=UPI003434A933
MMFRRNNGTDADHGRGRDNQAPHGNSGVINNGVMGQAQNQPGAIASSQTQLGLGGETADTAQWAQILTALDATLARVRADIPDYDGVRALLTTIQQQRPDEPDGRVVAHSLLRQLADRCGGAPGVATLVASAMSLVATAAG